MKISRHPALLAAGGLAAVLVVASLSGCGSDDDQAPGPVREVEETRQAANPLQEDYLTPLKTPPFHKLEARHFLPAMEAAVDEAARRIEEIAGSDAEPTVRNTLTALEEAERDVARIARLWYGYSAVRNDAQLAEIGTEFSRLVARHNRAVLFDRQLFERVERLYTSLPDRPLTDEAVRLIRETHKQFRRAGAHLDDSTQERLAEIDDRLAELDHQYKQARQGATHRHELLIEDGDKLDGLPESLVLLAERNARDRGHEEGWVFTLHAHSFYPFMRHFAGREQRRELYEAWMTRYEDIRRSDEDLGRVIERMADLRAERADILGYNSHLDYLIADGTLAGRQQLERLLATVTEAAAEKARDERDRLAELAAEDGIEDGLEPWDWWYYRERLTEQALEVSEEEFRAWFSLERVQDGMTSLANRLWGLTFHPRNEIPSWHLDVSAFEVRDAMGDVLGVLYLDPVHREGKRGGAWTSHYRMQHYRDGERIAPVVAVVANLPPSAAGSPTLLSPEQVTTLFHEFGHALHSLLSDVEHAALAGTNVPPDFVEFPALLIEQWALQPQLLQSYAWHHETGAVIDDDVTRALQRRPGLTSGLETLELIAAIELDLALHGAPAGEVPELETAERQVRERLELPAMISPRHHGGGLASLFAQQRRGGDFRTLWSETLAADAFAAFRQGGMLDRQLADSLRDEILARGNARDPMASFRAFRGRDPDPVHLLRARNLIDESAGETTERE